MSDDQKHEEGYRDTERKLRDRIEELEAEIAKLKYSKRYWLGEYDVVLAGRADANDRIEELEAKLAEAVEALETIAFECTGDEAAYTARTTLAELTGGKDE